MYYLHKNITNYKDLKEEEKWIRRRPIEGIS